MNSTRLQIALARLRRDLELSRCELTPREWRTLVAILASLVARESARDIDSDWRRVA